MKRTISILILVLILSFALPSEAHADASGTQVITVLIPCTVTLVIGGHGNVQVNGQSYSGNTSIQAPVGTVLTYMVRPDEGYRLSTLTYDGYSVRDSVKNGAYTAAPLRGNTELRVTFVKNTGQPPISPATGDESHFDLWLALMLCSGIGLITLLKKQKNRKRTWKA